MRLIDIFIETTEILCAAIRAEDGDKAFEAVTILLIQIFEHCWHLEETFEIMFPFLEQLQEKIEAGDHTAAGSNALALLTNFRAIRQPGGRTGKSAARLNG
jgi:hypothetical protein